VVHDERGLDDRPMAGHRYRYALGLVFGSVVPVTLSIMIAWTVLGVEPGGFEAALLFGGGFLAVMGPYLVGWIRSFVGLVGAASAVLVIKDALVGAPALLVIAASVGAVAVIGALIWWSLRLGHVWRPADARDNGAARSTLWPYPYV
jgi:hypothetical protein